jgi:hypothetical protein
MDTSGFILGLCVLWNVFRPAIHRGRTVRTGHCWFDQPIVMIVYLTVMT